MQDTMIVKSQNTKKYNLVVDDIGRTLESPLYSLTRAEQKMIVERINRALDRIMIDEGRKRKQPYLKIVK